MTKNITLLLIVLFAFTVKSQTVNYTVKNIKVNNKYSNFGTTFYGEDKVVYASPRKKSYIIRNNWDGNNQPFLDLFIGDIAKDGELINVKEFSNNLNTRYHEADVAFTKDKKTVYFSRNNYFDKTLTRDSLGVGLIQLYRAKIQPNGEWFEVEPMPFNSDHYDTGHPTLSADEKTLYFISNMPGSIGKTDVFKAAIHENGTIGNAINLGPKINTPEREMFVSISGNDELYFSSDGRNDGLGGLDVYVSQITNNNFSEPKNVGKPVNSEKDDFSFILNYESRRGYFSSNRNGGKGDDDIYTFEQEIPIVFECNQAVQGSVTEFNSGKLLPGSVVILQDENGVELDKKITDANALFNFEVACNKNYKLIATKKNYLTNKIEFFSTEGNDLFVPIQLVLEEFISEKGKCLIKINPIYFDFDKSDIRTDAKVELNKVVAVMKKYPDLIIEGGSHTDSRATAYYNEALSTRRANSTVNYIIEQGIDPSRISAKGYGESQLVNGCADGVKCTDKEHELNRRTEFLIVNYDDIKDKYPDVCQIVATKTYQQVVEDSDIDVKPEVIIERGKEAFDSQFEKQDGKLLIKINTIYFDLNSSYLREDALKELYKVIKIMKKYPKLIVECGSHTDSRASKKYNDWLSENRAKRTVDYLVSKGISQNRIFGKGYSEDQLKNKCSDGVKCTDAEHQQNRRTEFVILNPEVLIDEK